MSLIALCFFALLAAFLAVTVKEMEPRFASLLTTGAGVVFWLYALRAFLPVVQEMVGIAENSPLEAPFSAMFRALGLALAVSLSAGVCRDLGENGVAEKLELCGKGAILALAAPLLKSLLTTLSSLLS